LISRAFSSASCLMNAVCRVRDPRSADPAKVSLLE
jgi:hypothetical protein